MNHDIFIQKLEHYGVKNKEIRWFRSYLTNRKQCYKVNGQLSDLESITTGVPQGSCLGPLLFIIYVNDLHFSLRHSHVNMYADDTSLSFSSKSIPLINAAAYQQNIRTLLSFPQRINVAAYQQNTRPSLSF